jgi:AcrR family transcriptional regulator
MGQGQSAEVRSRPRDRRSQIIAVAAELFWKHGYDEVSVARIAAEVGITAGAVYKHVDSKETLLVESIREMVLAWYASSLMAADSANDAQDAIERLASAVAYVAIDRPAVVGLWHRESRHVNAEAREELIGLRSRLVELWVEHLIAARSTLDAEAAELRIRAALGLLNSATEAAGLVGRDKLASLYARLITAVLNAPDHDPRASWPAAPAPATDGALSTPSDRRELLLVAGAALISRRGFHRVGIDEIGEAAGIGGPSVYGHFPSKDALLGDLLGRTEAALDAVLEEPVADGSMSPRERVAALMGRFVDLALRERTLIEIYASERRPDSADLRAGATRRRHRNRAWTARLREARPELSQREARVMVLASLELVIAMSRSTRFAEVEDLHALGGSFALGALFDS